MNGVPVIQKQQIFLEKIEKKYLAIKLHRLSEYLLNSFYQQIKIAKNELVPYNFG